LQRTFRTSRANFSTQPVAAIEISVPICASEREKPVCHKFFEGNRFRQMCGTGVASPSPDDYAGRNLKQAYNDLGPFEEERHEIKGNHGMATALASAPEQGQLVTVRSRNWIVNEVVPGTLTTIGLQGIADPQTLVSLASVEDAGLGEEIQVVWEYERGLDSDRLRRGATQNPDQSIEAGP
jgi:hypothetical protein